MTLDTNRINRYSEETYTLPLKYPEDIYVAASLYISAFAHPPFSEECYVEDNRVEGLLSNPEVTAELLQLLHNIYSPNDTEDEGEVWEIKKDDFIKLFENFQERESTKRILNYDLKTEEEAWIKRTYLESVKKTVEELKNSKKESIFIKFDYPTKKVLESYLSSSTDPNSLVMIAGGDKTNQRLVTKIIKAEETNEEGIGLASMVGRIRDMGDTNDSYLRVMHEEMAPYLSKDQIDSAFIELNLETGSIAAFLAEVAKVKGDKFANQAATMLTLQYLEKVVGRDVKKLPQDLVFYTYPGTKTANPNILRGLINLVVGGKYGVEYTSEQWLETKDKQGKDFLIAKFHRD